MPEQNYYKILEITQGAKLDQIKNAYSRLALKFHPQRSNGSTEQFEKIAEAYTVLSTETLKEKFDRYSCGFVSMSSLILSKKIKSNITNLQSKSIVPYQW